MAVSELYASIRAQAAKVIVGQESVFEQIVVAFFSGGHVLIEGVPGTAKTLMAKTLAYLTDTAFGRVQFTADLMPSDIVGTQVYDLDSGRFHLREGPIFTQILLADEINRAPAKTQSALLEAMEERQVTIDGAGYPLGEPFMVLATQNPVEYEGTYPLPEAQVDRFLFKVLVEYPPEEVEQEVLRRYHQGFDAHKLDAVDLQPVIHQTELTGIREEIRQVTVEPGVFGYITTLVSATRRSPDILLGGSPRASIALLQSSKTYAALQGREYVVPDDIKALAAPVLRHRVLLRPEAEIEGIDADGAIRRIITGVDVPR